MPADEIVAGPHRFCDKIKFGTHRFHGVTDATLAHDEGWQFLRIGWSLERAEMTSRLVDVQYQNLTGRIAHGGNAGQSSVDGRAALRGSFRGLPSPVPLFHRARESGRHAHSSAAAPSIDPFQHHGSPIRPARHQRQQPGLLRERGGKAGGQSGGKAELRQNRGDLQTRPA